MVPLQTGDTIPLCHAENLTLVVYLEYTAAALHNSWNILRTLHIYALVPAAEPLPVHSPRGTVVHTPFSKAAAYSSVHCGPVNNLGAFNSIGGICDLKYIKLLAVQEGVKRGIITDCGDGMNPNMEKIIDLHPDATLLSPSEDSGGYGRIEKLNVPIIECVGYMEASASGRAERMRFYGLLFGAAPKVDSLFAEVDSCYKWLQHHAMLSPTSLSTVSELKSGSTWYVPGGYSTMGRLFNDACGWYAFAEDKHSGPIPSAFEVVFDKAGDADVWIIKYSRDRDTSYSDLKVDYIGYAGSKIFKMRNIYECNITKTLFYEETPFRLDYLLVDLIQILHPEIGDLGGLRYFCKSDE